MVRTRIGRVDRDCVTTVPPQQAFPGKDELIAEISRLKVESARSEEKIAELVQILDESASSR